MSLASLIPGYGEAVAAEARARALPFLGLPVILCGVRVRPISLRDYLRLIHGRSPFVCGGTPDRGDVALFLWTQQAFPVPGEDREAFVAQLDALDLGELAKACGEFVGEALMDAPKGGGGSAPVVSLGASMVHCLRTAYPGMGRDEVLDADLREVWQAYRLIRRDRDPTAILFNPLSDPIAGEYQRKLNAKPPMVKPMKKGRK